MTTVTAETAFHRLSTHPLPWKPMVRVTWLLHRTELVGLLVLAVGCALAMILSQDSTHAAYASYVANGCVANPLHLPCGTIANGLVNDTDSFSAVVIALHVLPVVIGLFIGAPLLAREIESGTYRFTWTQEVGRARFVLTTFVMLATVVTAVACLLGLLLGWYGHPFEVIGVESQWQSGLFDTTVFMLGAWTLFALALGSFLGALIGRTVAAMAATTTVVGGLLIVSFLNLVHSLLSVGAIATSKITPNGTGGIPIGALNDRDYLSGPAPGSWLVRGWITGPNRHVLSTTAAYNVLGRAYNATEKNFASNAVTRWLSIHHFTYWVSYQPASRYWAFQAVAGVILIGLAALLLFATIRALALRAAH
jgi:ABC-type transport system involved in multi-copper enzyme maturation permease subunit